MSPLPPDITLMGTVAFRNRTDRFGIKVKDRLRHMFVVGQTGTGKTTLIQTMATDDMEKDRGVAVIDPHGDLVGKLVDVVPKRRRNDLLYFDATDVITPFAFNPLAERFGSTDGERSRLVSAIISAFQKTWPDFWGPRSEHLLRMGLLALTEFQGMTFLDLNRFIADKNWREKLTAKVEDKVIRDFWLFEFARMPARLQAESLSPLQNKLGALIGNPLLRGILGQARSKLQLTKMLREEKILLVNLSRGLLGQDASVLLGSLMLSLVETAALGRAEQKEEERKPFFLYVDEFSFFATPSFIPMLAQGRKYGLGMTLAQQSLASLPPWLQADILTNSGTLVCFRVGAADAKVMAEEMAPTYEAGDLMGLPLGEFVVRLIVEGYAKAAFSGRTRFLSVSVRSILR
ncbi:MAG: type IV secretion system DNA-binding domain-containing protein [Acidobacteriia bacterium]|nr:type IV secretion system DNA-binding domain-containing protein [Terriglobia bacterium]